MKAYITIGCSASGKTTWAESQVKKSAKAPQIICRDDIRRQMVEESGRVWSWKVWWSKFGKKGEQEVTARAEKMIASAAAAGDDIIIADTNLHFARRRAMMERLQRVHGYETLEVYFPVSFEEACRRDAARESGVGVSVIARQFETMARQPDFEKLLQDDDSRVVAEGIRYQNELSAPGGKDRTPAFIFDIDGTLAHMDGRGPFDWDKVESDLPDRSLVSILRLLLEEYHIIIVSGRDGSCKEATLRWLDAHRIPYDEFFMREAGDCRRDTIVKFEIFRDKISDHYRIEGVFDDRPSVCRMWRLMGLKVFQVGNPYIEF